MKTNEENIFQLLELISNRRNNFSQSILCNILHMSKCPTCRGYDLCSIPARQTVAALGEDGRKVVGIMFDKIEELKERGVLK